MPPLGMHMTLARELAAQLAHPALRVEAGAFYLGAAAPDIRALTRWERVRTHFFDLDNFEEQHGVEALFAEHPQLAEARCLDGQTAAFVGGYLTHLEMDEAWIEEVYRPCFGERSPLKGTALANVLDRVLQFELDRRERDDERTVDEIREHLVCCAVEIATPFIERETLVRWRDISIEVVSRPPDIRRFASRHLRAYGVESEADLAHFLRNIPDLVHQSVRHVTQERIDTFLERSRRRALEAAREYLS
jgi:hypothetical protein